MKRTLHVLFLICAMMLTTLVYGQSSNCSKESKRVYQAVLKDLLEEHETRKILLSLITTKSDLERFNFKKPSYHGLDTISKTILDSTEWRSFLSSVSIQNVSSCCIASNFFKHRRLFYLNAGNIEGAAKTAGLSRKDFGGSLRLSPVIFSRDKTLAVCTFGSYTSPLESGATILFLQKEGSNWKIVKSKQLYIS